MNSKRKGMNHSISLKRPMKVIFMITLMISFCSIGCKKFVEVEAPVTSLSEANVYTSDATAASVLTGVYNDLSGKSNLFLKGFTTLSIYAGLSADELNLFSGITNQSQNAYFINNLSGNIGTGTEYWNLTYQYIFICNSAIEGLTKSNNLTPKIKEQLLGEAKFLRAFFYFYLTNLYGDVALAISTDYKINGSLKRAPRSEVYQQIISDLKEAQTLLNSSYLDGTASKTSSERVRPNKWTATALLARTYLYTMQFESAEVESTKLIDNISDYSLTSLDSVFLKNSRESIWQLKPVFSNSNTEDAKTFIIPSTGFSILNPFYLNNTLVNSFEPGDNRGIKWIGSYTDSPNIYFYPFKYKSANQNAPVTEFLMVFRLAEQYLIRAEARAQQNKITAAQNDLNAIRTRAGLNITSSNDMQSLITSILHERRIELFSEWGHRWLDLNRTNNIDAVMTNVTPQKGGTWESYKKLYPLSLIDIQLNPKLIQNPGY